MTEAPLRTEQRVYELQWTIAPIPVTLKGRSGEDEVYADGLVEACDKVKQRLAKKFGIPADKVEITRITIINRARVSGDAWWLTRPLKSSYATCSEKRARDCAN